MWSQQTLWDKEREYLKEKINELARNSKNKIWGFHSSDYAECRLLGCDILWLLYEWRHIPEDDILQ
jgi:hypothetical protein